MDMEKWFEFLGDDEEEDDEVFGSLAPIKNGNTLSTIPGTLTTSDYDKVYYNGNSYAYFDDLSKSWLDARDYCESLGGHLVTITDQWEQEFVNSLVDDGNKGTYWIGLRRLGNVFQWVTGEDFNFANWDTGEPSSPSSEQYVHMYNQDNGVSGRKGKWNDTLNDYNYPGYFYSYTNCGIICEWENDVPYSNQKASYLIGTNWKIITLNAPISPNNYIDTDDDGLTDWEETEKSLISIYNDGSIGLPPYNYYYDLINLDYHRIETRFDDVKYNEEHLGFWEYIGTWELLPITSDPTVKDSDGDNIFDENDLYPLALYKEKAVYWKTWEEATIFDFFANKSYIYNGAFDVEYPNFITGQGHDTVKYMKFGGTEVSKTGCGVISIYNVANALGRHRNLSDIIYEFDLNPLSKTASYLSFLGSIGFVVGFSPWNGFFGASPSGIENYLAYHEFKYEKTWNLDEFESWARDDRVFIVLYLHEQGAHYVMLQSDSGGTYTTYNHRSDYDAPYYEADLNTDILGNGSNTFLCGYYIQKVR
jgi:hypothetical protein